MSQPPTDAAPRLVVSLDATTEAPGTARRSLERYRRVLPDDLLTDLQLVTSELVTNSVRHSDATGPDAIGFRVDLLPGTVRVAVQDPGPGFAVDRRLDPLRDRHWGLLVVDRLSSSWGIRRTPEGTEVWADLPRGPT